MSSPYNEARDGNVPRGNDFGTQSDIDDSHAGAMSGEALAVPSDRLGEKDYR